MLDAFWVGNQCQVCVCPLVWGGKNLKRYRLRTNLHHHRHAFYSDIERGSSSNLSYLLLKKVAIHGNFLCFSFKTWKVWVNKNCLFSQVQNVQNRRTRSGAAMHFNISNLQWIFCWREHFQANSVWHWKVFSWSKMLLLMIECLLKVVAVAGENACLKLPKFSPKASC